MRTRPLPVCTLSAIGRTSNHAIIVPKKEESPLSREQPAAQEGTAALTVRLPPAHTTIRAQAGDPSRAKPSSEVSCDAYGAIYPMAKCNQAVCSDGCQTAVKAYLFACDHVVDCDGPSTPSSLVRFLPVSQYLLELASGVWVIECGVLTSREA